MIVIYNAILKSDISGHFKAYSSSSFQPTGIGLGLLWKGNICVSPIVYHQLKIYSCLFCKKIKKVRNNFSINSIKFITHFFSKTDNLHTYICTKCNDSFKFLISLKSYKE